MGETPFISIIIATRNNLDCLMLCLQSIKVLTEWPHEVIIVANECTDGTSEFARSTGAIVIEYNDHQGFSAPNNAGAKVANGEFLVFLNDDTVVTKDWLAKLYSGYVKLNLKSSFPIAAVGPSSNYVAGEQKYKGKVPPTFENREHISQELFPKASFVTGFLSGFCFLIKKDLFFQMGMWDEDLPFGAQDNAICLKLQRAGYGLGVVTNSYVHHFGSRTLDRAEFQKYSRGVYHLIDFCYKYHEVSTKLVATYLIELETFKDIEIFQESLVKTSEIVDEIYILNVINENTNSFDFDRILHSFNKVKILKTVSKDTISDHHNALYSMCLENGADWVISLNHDEVLEDKVTREYMNKLMNSPTPEVLQYWVHIYPFWGSRAHWRANGALGRLTDVRISKVLPNRKVEREDSSGMGMSSLPLLSSHNQAMTSIRIKSYRFLDIDDGIKRYSDKNEFSVYQPVISSIIDDGDLMTRKWIEDNGISVTTIVKNERTFVVDYMRQIYSFADELVFVDTGSTDGTKEFLLFCGAKVIDFEWKDDYASARNVGLEYCTKSWIFQMDLDESYPKIGDIRRMVEISSAGGYMYYINNLLPTGRFTASETVRLFRNHLNIEYTGYVHETVDYSFRENNCKIYRAPSEMVHYGFLKPNLRNKLKGYIKMNLKQMKDFPADPRPYYNLGLHLIEDPALEAKGLKYMMQSCDLDDRFFTPRKELGFYFLRKAIDYLQEATDIIPDPNHRTSQFLNEVISTILPLIENQQPIERGHAREAIAELKKEGIDLV